MAFLYVPCESPHLRQGEVIENLIELRPLISRGEIKVVKKGASLDMRPTDHKYAIIVSQDCDLEWDYKASQNEASEDKLLQHVLFCDLFLLEEIRIRSRLQSDLFKRVRKNQDERYHRFDKAPVGETGQDLPELCADFKATFSLPIEFVYSLTSSGQVTRKGFLPTPYLQDFIQRLYSFLGRVAIPES